MTQRSRFGACMNNRPRPALDLRLHTRLLLASAPFASMTLLWSLGMRSNSGVVDGVYALLFGLFVMAPFVSKTSRIGLRIALLIASPAIVIALIWLVSDLIFSLEMWTTDYLSEQLDWGASTLHLYDAVFFGIIFFVPLGFLLIRAAPLQVTARYWLYVTCSGALTCFLLFYVGDKFMCLPIIFPGSSPSPCHDWYDWMLLLPLLVGPVTFCMAAYFGATQMLRSAQSTKS